MEHNQPPVNTFYEKYKDYGVLPLAVPAASILLIINTTGIISNTTLIIITVVSKNLRSTANYLLAIECFFHSVHVMAQYYFAYVIYTGKNFDTLSTCLHIMTVPLVGVMIGIFLTFFTALDRLIAALLPFKYQRMNKLLYLGSAMVICIGYTVYILYLGYLNAEENKETMVICLIIEALHGYPSKFMLSIGFVLVFGTVFIYLVIGISMRYKGSSSLTTKKLFKSLFILCIIMVCSWIFNAISFVICLSLKFSEELTFFIPLYTGITINMSCISNFFVLTRYSSEYRAAARKFFNRFGFNIFKPIADNSKIFEKSSKYNRTGPIVPKEGIYF